jgi:Pyruvate/2-oxoglutarate dehydrogenase complex, dihydrolipoamide acyltransferase (E2) component, and related enzymes
MVKKEGDPVENGDMIAEVETDKATMEVECFDDGVLLKQYCAEGDEVPVGGAIAAIGEAGEAAPDAGSSAPAPAAEEVKEAEVSKQAVPAPAEPPAPAPAAPAEPPASAPVAASGDRVKASPVARKIAAEKGIDLAGIKGSGPGGRILKEDVINAESGAAPSSKSAPAAPETRPAGSNTRSVGPTGQ